MILVTSSLALPQSPLLAGLQRLLDGSGLDILGSYTVPDNLIPENFKISRNELCGEEAGKTETIQCLCEKGDGKMIEYPKLEQHNKVTFNEMRNAFGRCRPT